jgi:hypothetical protein
MLQICMQAATVATGPPRCFRRHCLGVEQSQHITDQLTLPTGSRQTLISHTDKYRYHTIDFFLSFFHTSTVQLVVPQSDTLPQASLAAFIIMVTISHVGYPQLLSITAFYVSLRAIASSDAESTWVQSCSQRDAVVDASAAVSSLG